MGEHSTAIPSAALDADRARAGMFQVVWRERWLIAGVMGLALVLGLGYLLMATPRFVAHAVLEVKEQGPRAIGESPQAPRPEETNFLNTEREKILSNSVLGIAMRGSGAGTTLPAEAGGGTATSRPSFHKMRTFADAENVLTYLKRELRVEVGKRSDTIRIEFDSPYPDEAKDVVAGVVDAYREYSSRTKYSKSGELRTLLERQLGDARGRIDKNRDEMQRLKKAAGVLSFDGEHDSNVIAQKNRLGEELRQARVAASRAESVYEEALATYVNTPERAKLLEEMEKSGAAVVTSDIEYGQIRQEISDLEHHIEQLRKQYLPAHPEYRAADQRMNRLRAAYVLASRQRWKTGREWEQKMQAAFAATERQAQDFADQAEAYRKVEGALKWDEVELQRLTTRISELNAEKDAGALNTIVFEQPSVESKPSRPDKAKVLALAVVMGLLLGVGGASLRAWVNPLLHTPEEVKATLGLPVLGMVPRMAASQTDAARAQKVRFDRTSETAEAYRTIRTALHFRTQDGTIKTLLVTSPSMGDGKTNTASNLAIAMAQAGKHVILVDADLRRPTQHKVFDVGNEAGLCTVLQDEDSLDDAIQHTPIENLDIMAAGPIPGTPSELLNSERLGEVLAELAARYDQVILDSAPVTVVSDARIVAASCAGTLLVVRAGKTAQKLSEQACDGLLSVGARVLGVVVNDVTRRVSADGSYYSRNNRLNERTKAASHERMSIADLL